MARHLLGREIAARKLQTADAIRALRVPDVEKELGISYPTVCKRLALVNELLGNTAPPRDTKSILDELERGDITAAEASTLLKQKTTKP